MRKFLKYVFILTSYINYTHCIIYTVIFTQVEYKHIRTASYNYTVTFILIFTQYVHNRDVQSYKHKNKHLVHSVYHMFVLMFGLRFGFSFPTRAGLVMSDTRRVLQADTGPGPF